jgi:hypothetical protein
LLLLLLELPIAASIHDTAVTYSSSPLKIILRAAAKTRRVIFAVSSRFKSFVVENRTLA